MRISRTKSLIVLFGVALTPIIYFGFRPQADREFATWCWLGMCAVVALVLVPARVIRCPRCDRETACFDNWKPWLPEHRRYIRCRRCGCVMDRAFGGREAE